MAETLNVKHLTLNEKLFCEAKKYIPGGVNSPVRAFKAVNGIPIFIKKGSGSKIYDIEGNKYIDYVMSWGALILGHAQSEVIEAVKAVINQGTSFGFNSPFEVILAKMISRAIPSIEMLRFTNSGTEAVMSAIRLARAYTKRKKILKFEGCYHGHCDSLLVNAGSGLGTYGISHSPGVLEEDARYTLNIGFNDKETLRKVLKKEGKNIAAIILEPVPANMGLVLPEAGFLEELEKLSHKYGILLIFDEVITGFRLTYGGYQNMINITPDLTILGKIIGGGFPVGAYGGKKSIMKLISPSGQVYQAGTLSGNPVAMKAGITTLRILKREKPYLKLMRNTGYLIEEIKKEINKRSLKICINNMGSMFTIFFGRREIKNFRDAKLTSSRNHIKFFNKLIKSGVLFPPSRFESCFVSTANNEKDIEKTIRVLTESIKEIG